MSLFLLQIVHAEAPHEVVRLKVGGELEVNLIDVCTQAIVKRGVGFFHTEAKVMQAIRDGLTEAIKDLKQKSVYAARR